MPGDDLCLAPAPLDRPGAGRITERCPAWAVPRTTVPRCTASGDRARRRPARTAVAAGRAAVPGSYVLDGSAPWVTGWDMIDVVHTLARDDAEQPRHGAAPGAGHRHVDSDQAAAGSSQCQSHGRADLHWPLRRHSSRSPARRAATGNGSTGTPPGCESMAPCPSGWRAGAADSSLRSPSEESSALRTRDRSLPN